VGLVSLSPGGFSLLVAGCLLAKSASRRIAGLNFTGLRADGSSGWKRSLLTQRNCPPEVKNPWQRCGHAEAQGLVRNKARLSRCGRLPATVTSYQAIDPPPRLSTLTTGSWRRGNADGLPSRIRRVKYRIPPNARTGRRVFDEPARRHECNSDETPSYNVILAATLAKNR
jgi:hypothetical protein